MKPIRIITLDFEIVGEIADYESLIFENAYYRPGEFQLTINKYKKYVDQLNVDRLIIIGGDVNKVAIIRHKEIGLNEDGKASELWTIKGETLNSILGRRITVPPQGQGYDRLNADAETIIKTYIENNCISSGDRKIPNLENAQNQNRGLTFTDQTRYKNLSEEVERLSRFSGLGQKIYVDYANQKMVFDVYQGDDRTTKQNVLPPIVFSTKFQNIREAEYMIDFFDLKNTAFVAGQGEGDGRRVLTVGEAEGMNRYELFVDARDVSEEDEDENPIPVAQIEQELKDRGQQQLSELNVSEYFEVSVIDRPGFEYEKDWFVGDIVTISVDSWGLSANIRITAVEEIYEANNVSKYNVILGTDYPNLSTKINKKMNQFNNELTK